MKKGDNKEKVVSGRSSSLINGSLVVLPLLDEVSGY
jgi:hypothetical protein